MRILVFGAGAIGCFLGASMAFADFETVLYVRSRQKAEFFSEQGITMTELADGSVRRARTEAVCSPEECGHIDLAFLTVKAYDTADAAPVLAAVPGDFPIICLQNGIGHMEILAQHMDIHRLLPGIIYVGSRTVEMGHIIRSGPGKIIFGAEDEQDKEKAFFGEKLLRQAGLPGIAVCGDELRRTIWNKLAVNSVVNTLSAIHGVANGVLREPRFDDIKRELVTEAAAVAAAYGVELSVDKLMDRLIEVCTHSAGNRSSMLEDVTNKRRTEIEYINGAICRMGEEKGIDTPVQRRIALRIQKIEEAYRER